jgi:hypothetical protein
VASASSSACDIKPTAGFILTPSWLLGTIFGFQWPRSHLGRGGGPIFVPTNPHGPFSEIKNIDFERSYGHFGPINKYLEVLFFRHRINVLIGLKRP